MFHRGVEISFRKAFKWFLLEKIMEEVEDHEEDSTLDETVDEFGLDSEDIE